MPEDGYSASIQCWCGWLYRQTGPLPASLHARAIEAYEKHRAIGCTQGEPPRA